MALLVPELQSFERLNSQDFRSSRLKTAASGVTSNLSIGFDSVRLSDNNSELMLSIKLWELSDGLSIDGRAKGISSGGGGNGISLIGANVTDGGPFLSSKGRSKLAPIVIEVASEMFLTLPRARMSCLTWIGIVSERFVEFVR